MSGLFSNFLCIVHIWMKWVKYLRSYNLKSMYNNAYAIYGGGRRIQWKIDSLCDIVNRVAPRLILIPVQHDYKWVCNVVVVLRATFFCLIIRKYIWNRNINDENLCILKSYRRPSIARCSMNQMELHKLPCIDLICVGVVYS